MKKVYFLLTLSVMLFFSCASPDFFYDYDRQADFSEYQTYAYYSDMKTGLSDLDDQRVRAAIDSVMNLKGIAKTDNPDFKINFYASYFKEPSRSRIGLGIGSGGGGVGVGVSGGVPIGGPNLYINLTIEFVDWPSNVLFWQTLIESRISSNMTPAERSDYFRKLIAKALAKYPPE